MNLVPLVPIVAGLPLLAVGVLGLTERLPRNRFGGVRTAATLRSDDAFRVGNKVAGLPTAVAGLIGLVAGAVAYLMPSTVALVVVAAVAVVAMIVVTLAAGVLANRAASAVPEPAPELPPGCAGCQCGGCGVLKKSTAAAS